MKWKEVFSFQKKNIYIWLSNNWVVYPSACCDLEINQKKKKVS